MSKKYSWMTKQNRIWFYDDFGYRSIDNYEERGDKIYALETSDIYGRKSFEPVDLTFKTICGFNPDYIHPFTQWTEIAVDVIERMYSK